jgi:hypothetical protein
MYVCAGLNPIPGKYILVAPDSVPTVGWTDNMVGEPTNQKLVVMFAENEAVLSSI